MRSNVAAVLGGMLVLATLVVVQTTDALPTVAAQPWSQQIADPPPPQPAYTDISPDGNCASGYTAFLVTHGVRVCYTPDPVVENQNLQQTCPSHPDLYICPGDAD